MACYPSQHMHPREWGLLDVCLRLTSGGKNPLYLDGRRMAARFADTRKDAIYESIKKLVKSGWLVEQKGHERNKETQRYEKTVYRVLNHEQWTAKHGTKACEKSDPASRETQTGEDDSSLESPTGASLDLATSQSGNSHEPVWNSRHNSVCNPEKESSVVCAPSVESSLGKPTGSSRPLSVVEEARRELELTRRQRMLGGAQ